MLKLSTFVTAAFLLAAANPVCNLVAAEAGPLKAEIVVGSDTYELDPAASGKEFADKLRAAQRGPLPAQPPKVDLTLRLSNTGAEPIKINIGGDSSRIELALRGPGAINLKPMVMMTREFRMGRTVVLEPKQVHDIPIKKLSSGVRGISKLSFWTEPGEYTLSAAYTSRGQGVPQLMVAAEPVKLNVVEPRKETALPAETKLAGLSFRSVEKREIGETPNGIALGQWELRFLETEVHWRHSDVVEVLTYTVTAAGIIEAKRAFGPGDKSIKAAYDPVKKEIAWENLTYKAK